MMETWSNSSVSSTPLTRQSSEFSLQIDDDASPVLDNAIQNVDLILSNQTKALSFVTSQYRTSAWSIGQMKTSLRVLNNSLRVGGKIIISGMGKSYKIASKTVATLNSLRMHSALLHPSEALHGDLGIIREDHNDSVIIISASGNSPELMQMLEYVPLSVPIILMTCNKSSMLAKHPKVVSLLLAEIPASFSETNLYGLSAPTITTTLCLTLLDAVAIALSELHINDYNVRKSVFSIHHPGGAIGINHQLEKLNIGKNNGSNDEKVPAEAASASNGSSSSNNKVNHDNAGEYGKSDDNDANNSDGCLDIGELVLMKKVQNTKYKQELQQFPENEHDFLRAITVNDFVIITKKNKNASDDDDDKRKLLDCELAREVYRECQRKQTAWEHARRRLLESCVPYCGAGSS